jgi:transcriptional regulator with PAS, ATPase and Fis domain
VRELERLIERSIALAASDVIQLDDLPPVVRGDHSVALMPSLDRRETLRAWGGRYVRLVLDRCNGNKREACRVLDISYHTLQAYLRQSPPVEAVGAEWEPGSPDSGEVLEKEVSTCVTTVEA